MDEDDNNNVLINIVCASLIFRVNRSNLNSIDKGQLLIHGKLKQFYSGQLSRLFRTIKTIL